MRISSILMRFTTPLVYDRIFFKDAWGIERGSLKQRA
jgi:hypothetical protein